MPRSELRLWRDRLCSAASIRVPTGLRTHASWPLRGDEDPSVLYQGKVRNEETRTGSQRALHRTDGKNIAGVVSESQVKANGDQSRNL